MAKVTVLFGAGAEGGGQFDLPSGKSFKRDIVLAQNVAPLANAFLRSAKSKIIINNGTTISHSSSSILYQTIVETQKIEPSAMDKLFPNDTDKCIAQRYVQSKQGMFSESDKRKLNEAFAKLYREKFYGEIKKDSELSDAAEYFLEHAGIYAYLDSLFNYLRKPAEYQKQCARVIKVYYAALVSILSSMAKALESEASSYVELYHKLLNGDENIDSPNKCLSKIIDGFENAFISRAEKLDENQKERLYYYQIKRIAASKKNELSCITTNYTTIGERIIGRTNCQFAYLHGKLSLFEELETKAIADVNDIALTNTVFPYLLVQSGVKPIISAYQIQEFYNACKMISEADILLIIGYGINPDDEHITNLLRKRLRDGKAIKIFAYSNNKCDDDWSVNIRNISDQLGNSELIEFYHTSEFNGCIDTLM